MARPRKYLPNGSVVFATLSLERGLLLTPNPLIELIVKSAFARARALFPVRVCHFIVEGTHIHIILVIIGPDDATHFIGHFKAEVAHRLNTLLGWSKRTVWCEGYDSPVILTARRALSAIAYLYANPAKDNLEDSIDTYPGLSTWKMFCKHEHRKKWKYLPRPLYRPLTKDMHKVIGYEREAARLAMASEECIEFSLEPDAWLEAFGITNTEDKDRWNKQLVARVRTLEERARTKRATERKRVIGAKALRARPLTLNYQPRRSGRRMWCLAERRSHRLRFIEVLKGLIKQAKEVYLRWHTGDYSLPYPPGLFPPPMPKLIEPLFAV